MLFKQKTAYEMRISDWSSDVCSSDLRDAPVTDWLPDFRPRFDGGEAVITVRHLLTHTSGLGYGFFQKPDGPYRAAGVSDGIDRPGIGLDENLRRLAAQPLLFRPGSAWL